ncbi:hypothetical protein [Brevundimonas subvibrioides]|uniref:hypothetical protein n=1 Tax=Brevundimonas subvibrioides TaxID=74313 RepID=UPI0032D58104
MVDRNARRVRAFSPQAEREHDMKAAVWMAMLLLGGCASTSAQGTERCQSEAAERGIPLGAPDPAVSELMFAIGLRHESVLATDIWPATPDRTTVTCLSENGRAYQLLLGDQVLWQRVRPESYRQR